MTLCIFNDQWQELEHVKIPVQSHAIQYGCGLFETLRTYRNRSLPFLQQHVSRLFQSITALNMQCDYSEEQVMQMVYRIVEAHEYELQRVKILLLPDGLLITSAKLGIPDTTAVKLTTANIRRSLASHKTTSYMDCQLAWTEAQSKGFDDSILIDADGMVYETGRGNIFWVKDDAIYTRENDVLPGIMRQWVSLNTSTHFTNASLTEILRADEVFITNSIHGIAPVSAIDETVFKSQRQAKRLQQMLLDRVAEN